MDRIARGVTRLGLGIAQGYLVELADELVLVDTGTPGNAPRVLAALAAAGRLPADLRTIVLTHQHADHAGSAAALVAATGAALLVHADDAAPVRDGGVPATGTASNRLMSLGMRFSPAARLEAVPVTRTLADGDRVGGPDGLLVLHAPGHTPGHIALYLERDGGTLFAGDAAGNVMGRLARPIVATDWAAARTSVRRLAGLEYETAVFGHGRPIVGGAAARVRAWSDRHAAPSLRW